MPPVHFDLPGDAGPLPASYAAETNIGHGRLPPRPAHDPEGRRAVAGMTVVATTIAARINEHHLLAQRHADTAIEHARQAGLLLLEAKSQVEHGSWLSWLEANTHVSIRSAQRYMRVAQGKAMPIRALKSDAVSHLDLAEHWPAIQAKSDSVPAIPTSLSQCLALLRSSTGAIEDIVCRFAEDDIATSAEVSEMFRSTYASLEAASAFLDRAQADGDITAIKAVIAGLARLQEAIGLLGDTQRQAEKYGKELKRELIAKFGRKVVDEWEEVPTRFSKSARVKRYRYAGGASHV